MTYKLIYYFLYMSVANTLIPLPTTPYILSLNNDLSPLVLAVAGGLGTCLAAVMEYYLLSYFFSRSSLEKKLDNKYFHKFENIFKKYAFFTIIFTGFTPIPFDPFRVAVIVTRYDIKKYILAVFVGRAPRYYLIATAGRILNINSEQVFYLFIIFVLFFLGSVLSKLARQKI